MTGGVEVPVTGVKVPGALGVANPERMELRESRIPERIATPMVPQPRTVSVSGWGGVRVGEDAIASFQRW